MAKSLEEIQRQIQEIGAQIPTTQQGIRQLQLQGGEPAAISNKVGQQAEETGETATTLSSPYQQFMQRIGNMLTQAQQGIIPQIYGLEREALGLEEQRARTGMVTPEELIGAPPSLQAGVRGAEMAAFQPGIERIRQVGRGLSTQLQLFEKALSAAKEYGKDLVKVSATPEVISGYLELLKTGASPSSIPEEIRNQVVSKMSTEDWQAMADSSKKTDELSRYQKLTALNSVRSAARQDPDIKIFSDIRGAYEQGRSGAQRQNGLGDIILMRTLAKITDPTTGVREEEFKTFESAQSTLARFGISLTKKMWAGDRLTNAARISMLGQLEDIYNQRKGAYDNAWQFYDLQGQELGEPQGQVLPKYYAPEVSESNTITAPDGSAWRQNQDGTLTQIK